MKENIKLALRGVRSHKMRSFLTMLGIIIGIAAIIAIVSIIEGTNQQIKENLIGQGNSTVTVALKQGDWDYEIEYNGVPDGINAVTDDAMNQLAEISNVEAVSKFHSRAVYEGIYHLSSGLSGGTIYGIDPKFLKSSGYDIIEGRDIKQEDMDAFSKVVILDENASKELFPDGGAVGSFIEIKNEPFAVVGIAKMDSDFEPAINTIEDYYMYADTSGGKAFIPDTTWCIPYNFDEPEKVMLKCASVDDMTDVGKKAADILNSYISPSDESIKYKADDLLEQAKDIQNLSKSTNAMLIWIAGISLLVGGIGVMNIMLVSVSERTAEIGLKKAIGAKKKKIMAQFLTEAAVLTSIGGIIGMISGVVLAYIISAITQTPVAISVPAMILAVVFSMAIGIIFGLLPSKRAADLNPIDALRHE